MGQGKARFSTFGWVGLGLVCWAGFSVLGLVRLGLRHWAGLGWV